MGQTRLNSKQLTVIDNSDMATDAEVLATLNAHKAEINPHPQYLKTGDQINITGNSGTATKLQTTRTINGVAFDGSANIVVSADSIIPKVPLTSVGAVNGVASLDSTGKILNNELPSFIDEFLKYSSFSNLPSVGSINKFYITLDTNKHYR